MPDAFVAETALQGEISKDRLNLNITLVNSSGASQLVSLSPAAVAELSALLKRHVSDPRQGDLTRMPQSFSVGHGRFERVILLRFEEDVAYGLAPELAEELVNALTDEVSEAQSERVPVLQ